MQSSGPVGSRAPRWRRWFPIALIVLGVVLIGFFGNRAFTSFRQLQYIQAQGLDTGSADVSAIRGWMTLRFVAVAYAVPEEYLYASLDVPFDRRNPNQTLGELGRRPERPPPPPPPGTVPTEREPPIVFQVRDLVTAYRANPVITGLTDIRPWMSIRYITNSTGVPSTTLLTAANLPQDTNIDKPLDLLAREANINGGPRALADLLKTAVPLSTPQPGQPNQRGGRP